MLCLLFFFVTHEVKTRVVSKEKKRLTINTSLTYVTMPPILTYVKLTMSVNAPMCVYMPPCVIDTLCEESPIQGIRGKSLEKLLNIVFFLVLKV